MLHFRSIDAKIMEQEEKGEEKREGDVLKRAENDAVSMC